MRRIVQQLYHWWRAARLPRGHPDLIAPVARDQIGAMLDTIGDALLFYDQDGTLAHASAAAARLAGGTAIRAPHPFTTIVHPDDRAHVADLFAQAFRGQVTRHVQFRLLDQAGTATWVAGAWGPRDPQRGNVGVWVLLREISAQVRTQDDLQQLQQTLWHNDRLRSLGRLSAEMAHELNNPLTAIQLRAEMLLDGALADEVRDELGALLNDMRYASRLVQHMLRLARQRETTRELVDLNELVLQIVAVRDTPLKIQQIALDLRLAPGHPLIHADTLQMQQVLLNLLANAQQALLEPAWRAQELRPPQLSIVTCIQANPLLPGEFVVLRVHDNGPGIPTAIQHRIMEPFFTTKIEGQGTGLGLSIVYDIIHAHGGTIEITSVEGEGTSVAVMLPRAAAPASQVLQRGAEPQRAPEADTDFMIAAPNYHDSSWQRV